jgi:hypothetical protein
MGGDASLFVTLVCRCAVGTGLAWGELDAQVALKRAGGVGEGLEAGAASAGLDRADQALTPAHAFRELRLRQSGLATGAD